VQPAAPPPAQAQAQAQAHETQAQAQLWPPLLKVEGGKFGLLLITAAQITGVM